MKVEHKLISGQLIHEVADSIEGQEEVLKGPLEEMDLTKLKVPTVVWIPRFLRISGGGVYAQDREPNDLDVIVAAQEDEEKDKLILVLDKALRLKIDRFLKKRLNLKGETCWHGTPYGANWKNLPMFDLALIPRNPLEFEEINDPEFAEEFYKSKDGKCKWKCPECGWEGEATEEEMYERMMSCPECGAAMEKIEVGVTEKAMSAEAKRMADTSKKEDKVEVGRFFYPLKTSLSPFAYRVGEVYGIDEMIEKLKQVAQRRKADTEIIPVYLNKKYD